MGSAWARVPLRIKLALAFTGVMAVLLAGASVTLSLLSARNLDRAIDDGLAARAGDAVALVGARPDQGRLADSGEALAQVLDEAGRVLDTTPGAGSRPLLTPAEVAGAQDADLVMDLPARPGAPDGIRVLARAARDAGDGAVVVVGESLEQRQTALEGLHALLAVGGPLALLVAALAGYAVAAAALRPVERMRRRAAELTAGEAEGRLPVPPANDEIARLGVTLNRMLTRLHAALARERSFVADASHELRTPLAILRTELELALRGRRTREELDAAVRSAAEETERLNRLADDLLVVARSDQAGLPLRAAELEADELLAGVARRFAGRARAEDRALRAEAEADLRLRADPTGIERALGNMVDNALRHGRGEVVLSAARANGHFELHVRDSGPGFPAAFLPEAFERFSRADEARSRGGTGLGLAIAAAVAAAHGGAARAANRQQGGADVWLELPEALSSSAHVG